MSPMFLVPKNNSNSFWLVTNQSAGVVPLNALTAVHDYAFPMDNMVHLDYTLLQLHKNLESGEKLILFKSNVFEAYQLLPMHPYWKIKQINTVDGLHYVDYNNTFRKQHLGDLFIAFMSLILWIAQTHFGIKRLLSYSKGQNCSNVSEF